jgi:uncharacterized protein YoxC
MKLSEELEKLRESIAIRDSEMFGLRSELHRLAMLTQNLAEQVESQGAALCATAQAVGTVAAKENE